jgi:hypothetical protein
MAWAQDGDPSPPLEQALCLLLSGRAKDALQLAVYPVHPVGGGRRQSVQECHHRGHVLDSPRKGRTRRPLMVDGGGDGLA